MNSFTKLVASISALIASLSFAWIALTITGTIPHRQFTVHHDGSVDFSVGVENSGIGGFHIENEIIR